MMTQTRFPLGSSNRPLRVAIVGSGPSGFYAAEALFNWKDKHVRVDMFERMSTPYGLVRYGVAPDHQSVKKVIRVYEMTAQDHRFRFFGNVQVGTDLLVNEIQEHYDQIIYAVGCESDRRLGIPGEDLPGSHTATAFVSWYNGHPDHRNDVFDLNIRRVAVVGVGNVAMDVTRILMRNPDDLASTDIAEYALEKLRMSLVEEVIVLGRRGPAQAKFTPREIMEIGNLSNVDLVVDNRDLELDEYSQSQVDKGGTARKNVEYLKARADVKCQDGARRVLLRFFTSPVEIMEASGRVSSLRVERNRLFNDEQGKIRSIGIGEFEVLPVDLVFRSVGYRGTPLPGLPFDKGRGVIPSFEGRVIRPEGENISTGEYVVGWIKRGPRGLIGSNKGDSAETVRKMMEDIQGKLALPFSEGEHETLERLLLDRGIRPIQFRDWHLIDEEEQERGKQKGKVREKITDPQELTSLLNEKYH